MLHKIWPRLFAVIMILGMVFSPFQAGGVSARPAEQGDRPPKPEVASTVSANRDAKAPAANTAKTVPTAPIKPAISSDAALAKIHPDLREIAKTASPVLPAAAGMQAVTQEAIYIEVIAMTTPGAERAEPALDLSKYFVDGKVIARPSLSKGETSFQVYLGYVYPYSLMKIASLGEVQMVFPIVFEQNAYPDGYPIDDGVQIPEKTAEDWAALRANADKLRAGILDWADAKAIGDGRIAAAPEDWFEVAPDGPHKAAAAWARGFTGEGVTVAVNDDGIDPAHPDLMGTQKIYSSTVRTEYNGWPMVFSPFSQLLYVNDVALGTSYVSAGYSGLHYVDTSFVPEAYSCGTGLKCFEFTPLIDYGTSGYQHTYVYPTSWSLSGEVHVGTHPDNDLRDYIWGEKPAVLVVDPNVAGVYDTVVVDLDNDYDFRDDKPLTKADTTNATTLEATKNNMISYRDFNGDGYADISGGMVYFIGDGATCIPASDYVWGCPGALSVPPGNGDLVAFSGSTFDRAYSHGTQCASNVVGQGVVQNASLGLDNSFLPVFRDLVGPTPDGRPNAAVYGMAPGAKVVNVSDIYLNHVASTVDAYIFAAVGYDAVDQTGYNMITGDPFDTDTDTIVATSNSYGDSAGDNDGWDYRGQVVSFVQRWYGPYLSHLDSTGNGAPGYGTTSPPSGATAISVGASTEYGSTGWDTITETNQINYNDVVAFSNSGPGARGGAGVDVLAGGAYAAGDEELNYYPISTWGVVDGNLSWVSWGGTSRSAPTAMGVLALIYQAYKEAHGVWPTHEQAKALLMSSATDVNSNVLKQGAGSVNADRGTAAASGEFGVYTDGDSSDWTPGDFRGVDYPAFAHVVYPGGSYAKTFTVVNDSPVSVTVDVSDAAMTLIKTENFDFEVTPDMIAAESVFGAGNRDNFYKAFQYFIPITATASADASMQNIVVPADTDLMVVRQRFPYADFDPNGNYAYDNRFYLMVYNWMDVDGNGMVWDDKNANGVVNFINSPDVTLIDVGTELAWDDPRTELDQWEYARFGYNRPVANTNELMVQDPLARMHDGLFIGLRHLFTSRGAAVGATLSYQIEFYKKSDTSWISTDVSSLEVPALGSATFDGFVDVPADLPAGDYEAAIEVFDPSGTTSNNIVIPVTMNVAQDFAGVNTFGGQDTYLNNYGLPYNNAAVRGYQEWSWRPESGDWRFFYLDINNTPVLNSTKLSEDFEGAFPPAGWVVADNAGDGMVWDRNDAFGAPNRTTNGGGAGFSADADSDATCLTGAWDTELWSPAIDLSGTTFPQVSFASNLQDFSGTGEGWLDVSTDGGATWTNEYFQTVDTVGGVNGGGENLAVDLSAYAGQTIHLRWRYSDNADTCSWFWQIDTVRVEDYSYPYDPTADVIVKDQWEGPAADTHNDIDTVVLGPAAGSVTDCWYCFTSDTGFFGPYTLDTVGASPNTNVSAGVWLFDTSSGGNEDWVTFPLQDGLHRLMQHNVLFEGDEFDVVFTKTVGMVTSDVSAFNVTTYLPDGVLGDVTLESTLELPDLLADGFISVVNTTTFLNEPIPDGPEALDFWYEFEVTNGINIEAFTDSGNISDIDLFLFYDDGTGFAQMASSAGSSAVELVSVDDPADGTWAIGIDNYSGPAGNFDMTLNVTRRSDATITFTGTSTETVAANTPVTLGVGFEGIDTPGVYTGVILVGTTPAPSLKTIPFTITRLAESSFIQKSVDVATAFAGDELNYTIDLFNLSDADAQFTFTDPLPADVEFVDASISGLPIYDVVCSISEGFEGAWPPAGWNVVTNSGAGWNLTSFWGVTNVTPGADGEAADADADAFGTGMNTEMWSPAIDLRGATTATVVFDSNFQDFGGGSDAYFDITTDGGMSWTNIWTTGADEPVAGTTHTFTLDAYTGNIINVRWHFVTPGWDWFWQVDDVSVTSNAAGCVPGVIDPWGDLTYDALSHSLVYTGLLPLGDAYYPSLTGGDFEDGVVPPADWMVDSPGTSDRQWMTIDAATYPDFVHSGAYAAWLNWPNSGLWDEWLVTPAFVPTASDNTVGFWAEGCNNPAWAGAYDVQAHVLDANGNVLDTIFAMSDYPEWDPDTFAYREVTRTLAAYAGESIRVAFQGTGDPYCSFGLDDVSIPGAADIVLIPSATVHATVLVSNTVSSGDWVTNTATLEAEHVLPQGNQTDSATDDAVTHIGAEDFITSYKDATATVSPNGMIEYQIHVINSGDALAHVVMTDTLPAGVTFDGLDTTPPSQYLTYDAGMNMVMWDGNVAPGEHRVFTYWVTVDPSLNALTAWVEGDVIENTAYLSWNGDVMTLPASSEIVFDQWIGLPFVNP